MNKIHGLQKEYHDASRVYRRGRNEESRAGAHRKNVRKEGYGAVMLFMK